MARCPEPGEPGFSEGLALGFLLGVALRLAGDVGIGLPLVNALRERFPGADLDLIGRLARTTAQGMSAAAATEAGAFGDPVPFGDAPILNGGPFADQPGERYYVDARVAYRTPGEPELKYSTVRLFATDPMSIGELYSALESEAEQLTSTSPRIGRATPLLESIDIVFIGRRF